MAITVQHLSNGSTAATANAVIGSQTIAAPATWTRLTTLGTTPRGGRIRASSDAEAFRVAIVNPIESSNASGPMRAPADNGTLISAYGAGAPAYEATLPANAQVWVKRA